MLAFQLVSACSIQVKALMTMQHPCVHDGDILPILAALNLSNSTGYLSSLQTARP